MQKVMKKNLEEIRGLRDVSFKGIMYRNEDILRSILSETFEEKKAIAKNLLINNVSLDIILQSTGLSIEEIEKLREIKND